VDIQLTNITYEMIPDPDQVNETVIVYNHVRWNGQFHVVEMSVYEEEEVDDGTGKMITIIEHRGSGSSNTQDPDTQARF
jgi:hypothetical protein